MYGPFFCGLTIPPFVVLVLLFLPFLCWALELRSACKPLLIRWMLSIELMLSTLPFTCTSHSPELVPLHHLLWIARTTMPARLVSHCQFKQRQLG
jgi:hypothetical protein